MSSRDIDPKPMVATGYDRVAHSYARLETPSDEWPRMRWLRELLAMVPPGAPVLDVGCGNGVPALREIARTHQATGVDISGVQISLARRNVPGARLLGGDVMSVDFADRSFAAIAAFYVVEHIPREEHLQLFERFARWLRPGGHLLFTIETEEQPGTVGDWLGTPMFFSQFGVDESLQIVEQAGFELLRKEIEDQREGDKTVTYLWVLTRLRPR